MSAFPIRVHRGKFGIPNPLPPLGMGIQKFKTKITAQYDSRNAYFWWKGLLARDSIYAIARYICYRPFVRSSVRPSVLSVGLSVWFVCYTGESVKNCWSYDHATFTMTVVSSRLTSPRNSKGNIRIGAPNAWEKGKKTCNFQPIGRRISEMVQDKTIGLRPRLLWRTNRKSHICAFGFGTKIIYLGWPTAKSSNFLGILRYFAFLRDNKHYG